MKPKIEKKINIKAELLSEINKTDLADLCSITEEAIKDGGGFGWINPPPRETLKKYWKGVVLIKNRKLIVGRLDGRSFLLSFSSETGFCLFLILTGFFGSCFLTAFSFIISSVIKT